MSLCLSTKKPMIAFDNTCSENLSEISYEGIYQAPFEKNGCSNQILHEVENSMRKSIVLAADNAYLIPLETTIKSVLYHNRDVDFYILNSDIAPEWFKLLGRKMEVVNSTIRSVHIDKELLKAIKQDLI